MINLKTTLKRQKPIFYILELILLYYVLDFTFNIVDNKINRYEYKIYSENTYKLSQDEFDKLTFSKNFIFKNNKTFKILPEFTSNILLNTSLYKDPLKLKLSKKAKLILKKHEHLVLNAYDIGDGNISIGYGHSEKKDVATYDINHSITESEAEIIYEKDIKRIENNIKWLFKQWQEKDHKKILLTQNMFDCLVSMTFNMGIGGIMDTEFITDVRNGYFFNAAKKIKFTKASDKFPGLQSRRLCEYNWFTQDLKYLENNDIED